MKNNDEKYYVSSSGEIKPVSSLHTTYLINALNKKTNEIFNSKSKEDYQKELNQINILREELTNRYNEFEKGLK